MLYYCGDLEVKKLVVLVAITVLPWANVDILVQKLTFFLGGGHKILEEIQIDDSCTGWAALIQLVNNMHPYFLILCVIILNSKLKKWKIFYYSNNKTTCE